MINQTSGGPEHLRRSQWPLIRLLSPWRLITGALLKVSWQSPSAWTRWCQITADSVQLYLCDALFVSYRCNEVSIAAGDIAGVTEHFCTSRSGVKKISRNSHSAWCSFLKIGNLAKGPALVTHVVGHPCETCLLYMCVEINLDPVRTQVHRE